MLPNHEIVIVSACRTAIGNYLGSIATLSPGQLGAVVVKEAVTRSGIAPELVDEVAIGNVLGAGFGQGIARQAAIWAGLPVTTPAFTVNKLCGSGMKSIILAAQAIMTGDADTIIAGGTESMSSAAFVLKDARKGLKMGGAQLIDTLIVDGLTDSFSQIHMGITAENIAQKYGISREEQDTFAVTSQNKAEAAIKSNRFRDEIIPVEIPQKKGEPIRFAQDEFPRFGTTAETIGRLKPAFVPDGTVTAGNASGINDGAAAVMLMSRSRADELQLKPLAKIRAYATAAVEPSLMGLGPIPATKKALIRAGLSMRDIQLVEATEAFASQSLAISRELDIPEEILNVNGGAIALGHPIGASGARIVVTLLYEMIKRDLSLGLATLCIGGGMGASLILERD